MHGCMSGLAWPGMISVCLFVCLPLCLPGWLAVCVFVGMYVWMNGWMNGWMDVCIHVPMIDKFQNPKQQICNATFPLSTAAVAQPRLQDARLHHSNLEQTRKPFLAS